MLSVNFLPLFVLCVQQNLALESPCAPDPENPQDCVCNATYCDTTPPIDWCLEDPELISYVTSVNGDRFNVTESEFKDLNHTDVDVDFILDIDPCKTYQKITGFGGALTDAAAEVIKSLSDDAAKNLIYSYFNDEEGIGYNYLRIPLGSSDASDRDYTFEDESMVDPLLTTFSLANEDKDFKIPLIIMAQEYSSRPILVMGATWSAPKWMTVQEDNTSKLMINPRFYEAWANYHLKALEEYQSQGINFTYLTPANEPLMAAYSIQWKFLDYQFWFNNYLCPMIKNSTFQDVRFLLLDDKTTFLPFWQMALFDPITYDCADGFATQWYSDPPDVAIKIVQEMYCWLFPEKELQSTEASICQLERDYNITSDYDKAAKYARNIITKLNSCTTAFLDYNIALDTDGGPSSQDNFCYSAILVNSSADEFYKKPLFYYLGHFSKFILPGSVRTEVSMYPPVDNVTYVAFKLDTIDCSLQNLVTVILNTNEVDYKANICHTGGQCASISVPKGSIISTVSSIPSDLKC